jgi:hypothetical protein
MKITKNYVRKIVKETLREAQVPADVRVADQYAQRIDQKAEYLAHWPQQLKRMMKLPAGVNPENLRQVLVTVFGKPGSQIYSMIKSQVEAPGANKSPDKPTD